jgi:hypothetical protein
MITPVADPNTYDGVHHLVETYNDDTVGQIAYNSALCGAMPHGNGNRWAVLLFTLSMYRVCVECAYAIQLGELHNAARIESVNVPH